MFAFTDRGKTRVLSIAIPIDLEPTFATAAEMHWRDGDIRTAEYEAHYLLTRLSRGWSEILESYKDELSVELLRGINNGKRLLRLDATYKPSTQTTDAFDTKVEDYRRVLIDFTAELLRVVAAYGFALTIDGDDIPIRLGEGAASDSVIYTKHPVVLNAAVSWLLDDAKKGSTRNQITVMLSTGDSLVIPAAPGTYPKSKSDESMTVCGVFDAPNDDRRVTMLRLQKGRKTLTLKVPPTYRDAVINAQLDRTRVDVTVKKRYIVIAGTNSFEDYEMVRFEPVDAGLFSRESGVLSRMPRLVSIKDRRTQTPTNDRFSGADRRTAINGAGAHQPQGSSADSS